MEGEDEEGAMRTGYIVLALIVPVAILVAVAAWPRPQPNPVIPILPFLELRCGELAVQVENHAGAGLLYALYLGPPGQGVKDAHLLPVPHAPDSLPELAPGAKVLHRFPAPCGEYLVWAWLSGLYKSEETIIEAGKTSPVRFVFP